MLYSPNLAKGSRSLQAIARITKKIMAETPEVPEVWPRTKRFAPLDPAKSGSSAPKLKGIVFDVDGTLW